MKLITCVLIVKVMITSACLEPLTSIQIQNYDGPIYLHAPTNTCKEDVSKILHTSKEHNCRSSTTCDSDCTCVSKHSTKCVPINTASESSCTGGTYYIGAYPQYSSVGFYPAQGDTQIYYTIDGQWKPSSGSRPSDCGSLEHSSRDDKCQHRCCNRCGNSCSY